MSVTGAIRDETSAAINASRLETVKACALDCQSCALRQGARNVVFGEGPPDAKLMVIGEGPGADEDALGRPFVGKAGQLLDRILASAGFSRSDTAYIANIVKCRPPGNRAPLPEEVASCLPHLRRQFAILRPAIVVLLGATAYKAIIDPEGLISKVRGNWVERGGVYFMPTYHPAALLRNPSLKRDVWSDFLKVVEAYKEKVDENHHLPAPNQTPHKGGPTEID